MWDLEELATQVLAMGLICPQVFLYKGIPCVRVPRTQIATTWGTGFILWRLHCLLGCCTVVIGLEQYLLYVS